jgi:hypothetical protein
VCGTDKHQANPGDLPGSGINTLLNEAAAPITLLQNWRPMTFLFARNS